MSNEELLEKIAVMLDEKLEEKLEVKLEEKLEEKLDKKLEEKLDKKLDEKFDKKFDEKLDRKFDEKLSPIKADIRHIKLKLENEVEPNIRLLAENYVPAAKRYETEVEKLEKMRMDLELVKKVVADHSVKLQSLVG